MANLTAWFLAFITGVRRGRGAVALPPSLERGHIPNMLTMFIQLLLLLLAIFEYKGLLLKVIFLSSECTRIDLRFQKNSFGGNAPRPPRLVWFHSIVLAPYPKISSYATVHEHCLALRIVGGFSDDSDTYCLLWCLHLKICWFLFVNDNNRWTDWSLYP